MIKKLKKKGFYTTHLVTSVSVWYENKEGSDYRFRMIPKIYKIIKKYWNSELAPFVMEVLYMMDSWCYRSKYDNLIGMLVVDLVASNSSGIKDRQEVERLMCDKLEIMTLAFKEANKKRITNVANLLADVNFDYRKVYEVALHLHHFGQISCLEYFNQVVEPIIKEIIAKGACSELFDGLDWKNQMSEEECDFVAVRLNVSEKLDKRIVHFFIENALCYIYASDCNSYNPYWIFGSEHYEELIRRVWKYDYSKNQNN